MKLNQRRFRHLLTTVSAAAMIACLSAEANAACQVVSSVSFPVTTTTDCIVVSSPFVGSIVIAPTGSVLNQFGAGPTATTHAIAVTSTLSGSIQNSGSVLAEELGPVTSPQRFAIDVSLGGLITQGITNSNQIKAFATKTAIGIFSGTSSFAGGIVNNVSGLIQGFTNRNAVIGATSVGQAEGIELIGHTFNGGIFNAGTIVGNAIITSADTTNHAAAFGIQDFVSTFSGGITSSGTIFAHAQAAGATNLTSVAAGIIVGAATSLFGSPVPAGTFFGGITNSGMIQVTSANGVGAGIGVAV